MSGPRFVPVSACADIGVPRDADLGRVESMGPMMTSDHEGNLLRADRCALCGQCWTYACMKDPRQNARLGMCIYGGPYASFVIGYRPGEVEAARAKAYGRPVLVG